MVWSQRGLVRNFGRCMTWNLDAERDLWADICYNSFWWFLRIGFGAEFYMRANPTEVWLVPRLHKPICDWLQDKVLEWEANRASNARTRMKIALIIPRAFGKTVIGTKALSMWGHLRNPNIATYIGSEVYTKAAEFLSPIKTIYESKDPYAWFPWLYGVWYSPERTWMSAKIVHAARKSISKGEPSFSTWGVESGITGAHPDWGAFDDPLSEEKIRESGNWINAVNQSFASLRPAFRTDSFFLLALTRYRDNDVVGSFIPIEGVRSWTGMPSPDSRFTPRVDGEWDVYFLQALDGGGASIYPEVWTTSELKKYETTRPVEFAAQMMNEPGSGEHMPLTSEQIAEMWIDKESVPTGLSITVHCDTAFKTTKRLGKGDESVVQVWGHDPRGNGEVYFLEGYSSNTWRIEDFTDELVKICQRYKKAGKRVRLITDERDTGGKTGVWENWLVSQFHGAGIPMPPFISLTRTPVKKITRIREAAGFWVDGLVHIVKGAPGAEKLIGQMIRIGVSSHDDWADAAADVFADEVYRPMLNPTMEPNREEGGFPIQPGDDILGRHWDRLTNDTLRQIYDFQHGTYIDARFSDSPDDRDNQN